MAKMTKLAACMAAICLLVALGSMSARADEITLGGSNGTNVFGFSASPVTVTLLTSCSVNGHSSCFQSNAIDTNGNVGSYYLDASGVSSITLSGGPTEWTVSQSSPIAFDFWNGSTTYLTGNLELEDLGVVGSTGLFNTNLMGNLAVTGGTLAGLFPTGQLGLTINLPHGATIGAAALNASISSGEVDTPEPASLSLVGLGLLGFAFLYRRHLRAAA